MAEIRFDDGRIVTLSEETVERLRKEFYKDDKQLKVDRFRAVKDNTLVRIAIVSDRNYDWDGTPRENRDVATHLLYNSEVREIIAGLTRMLDE